MRKQPIIEVPANCPTVRAVTLVGKNAINYAVEALDGDEWVCLWEKTVKFGRDKFHRTGGLAFVQASQDQESQLENAKSLGVK